MIQERRGMMKVWNVFLICLTFWLTLFGTFLTRSGLIASVHSFAQSGIGIWFVYVMGVVAAVCIALTIYRLPKLRNEGELDSLLSREAAFVGNNWGFLSLMVFIAVATTWPRISEWLLDQKSTLGPTFYNAWLPPLVLTVLALMGVAPLLGWRKTSPELFKKSFRWPVLGMAIVAVLHVTLGKHFGFPAFISVDPIYPGLLGDVLSRVSGTYPFFTIAIVAFNLVVVVQEFARGVTARQKNAVDESVVGSLLHLVAKSRRRYGGYIVHVGIALMFIGFTGRAWSIDKEASLMPGQSTSIEEYTITYAGPRMEVDSEKRMIFADVDVVRNGKAAGRISPAKFIYKTMPEAPATIVGRYITAKNDLYMIIGMVNPQTKVAAFQIHVNMLISFIWLGAIVLALGALVAMWPDVAMEEVGAFGYVRAAASVTTAVVFGLLLAGGSAQAYGAQPPPVADGATMAPAALSVGAPAP
jgi:cytochrome c-type biogenesis protein CcmF